MKGLKDIIPVSFINIGSRHHKYHIIVDPNVRPIEDGCRRMPIELWEEIETQLQKIVIMGIITLSPVPLGCCPLPTQGRPTDSYMCPKT